jgi:four helix bundle protein
MFCVLMCSLFCLNCWQLARGLVKEVFALAVENERLRKDYDTSDQLKRAALSVMNNIAEGFARFSPKEFKRFLDIAQASATEVKSMLYVLEDISYMNAEKAKELRDRTDHVRNTILALIRYLNKSINK